MVAKRDGKKRERKYTPKHAVLNAWRPAFLAELAERGNITDAAEASGIQRLTAYHHRGRDPEFAAQWDTALEQAADRLEHEAFRRAHDGTAEPVYYKGEVCGHVRKYSDVLMMFLLKGIRPEKYRERQQLDVRDTSKLDDPHEDFATWRNRLPASMPAESSAIPRNGNGNGSNGSAG